MAVAERPTSRGSADPLITSSPGEEEALSDLYEVLVQHGPDEFTLTVAGVSLNLPKSAMRALKRVVTGLNRGKAVMVIPVGRRLTSQQAADLLGMSRPFLNKLLDQDVIPSYRVGSHRRVELRDVLAYRDHRSDSFEDAMAELSAISEEAGYE